MNTNQFTETPDPLRWQSALLEPHTVALIGASGDATKNTSRPQRFLQQCHWQGKIVPINPSRDELFGIKTYKSVLDYPHNIDHAFVMTAAEHIPSVIEQCGRKAIPVLTIYTDGFAEMGGLGIARQASLVKLARRWGVRLLGPNCIGLIQAHSGLALTVNAVIDTDRPKPGSYAMISQSGSMIGSLMTRGQSRGIGFSTLISVGNECDLDLADMINACASQSQTEAIALFMETVRDAKRFREAVANARRLHKPVAAYLIGRSALGNQLAQSHTGALAGSGAALSAFLDDCGVIRLQNMEALLEIAPLLRSESAIASSGRTAPRVAVLTTTGGAASMVMDNLGLHGIEPAEADEHLQALVDQMMLAIDSTHPSPKLRQAPIIDLTLAGSAKQYAAVLAALAQWDACDAAVAVVGSSARSKPELAVHPILEHAPSFRNKPFAAFFAPEANEALALLSAKQIAGFRTAESCADAVAAMLRPRGKLEREYPTLEREYPTLSQQSLSRLDRLWQDWLAHARQPDEAQSYELFERLEIPCSAYRVCDPSQVSSTMQGLALDQWVLKLLSNDITHKSDIGGVLLELERYASWDEAISALQDHVGQHAQHDFNKVLVQAKQKGLGEVLIGYRHDAVVGPVVVLGIGGMEAELNPQVALRPAPICLEDAQAMIAEIPSLLRYQGFRKLPRGDMGALAHAICSLSQLACDPMQRIDEAEINPLLILHEGSAHGVIAVDAVIRLRKEIA
ncbi:MAG: acetate--CoA ligase family protein [Burkholderiaceae bacterium]